MATYTNVNINESIDLNSLFNLTYNFDLLKGVIDALVKQQKNTNQRLIQLEDGMASKERKIKDMEYELSTLNINHKESREILVYERPENNQIDTEEERNKNEIENDKTTKIHSTTLNTNDNLESKNEPISFDLTNDPNITKLIKKIENIENEIKYINYIGSDVKELKRKLKVHDEDLKNNQFSIFDIYKKLDEMNFKVSEFDNQFGEINNKLIILESMSVMTPSDQDKKFTNDELSLILHTLEKKLSQKIVFIDSKFTKIDDDILKLKKLEKGLDQTNKNVEQTNKNIDLNIEKIDILFTRIEDLKNNCKNNNNLTMNSLKEQLDNLRKHLDNNISEINDTFETRLNSTMTMAPSDNTTKIISTGNDEWKLKDINRRITELEKSFKSFLVNINIEHINKEINKINENLNKKANQDDIFELKDLNSQSQLQINIIKDSVSQLMEDRKVIEEIAWIRKKVESILSSMQNHKKDDDSNSGMINKIVPFDTNKYVEINQFTDFKNTVGKEFERMHYSINELNRLIEEILLQIKTKVSDTDLKNLEEYLTTKIDELKSASNKKFADKAETTKNLKYLDQQIKHIIEVYIKKSEKTDNWLLAKKPIGGNSCASCESYIGELQDNTQYVPWNKYPMRDPNDKLYRVGNGFSKMLQMINVENINASSISPSSVPNKLKPLQTSNEFYRLGESIGEIKKKEINLPKVIHNKHRDINMSMEENDYDEYGEMDDPLQPKM